LAPDSSRIRELDERQGTNIPLFNETSRTNGVIIGDYVRALRVKLVSSYWDGNRAFYFPAA
jgi:hypothetical protein